MNCAYLVSCLGGNAVNVTTNDRYIDLMKSVLCASLYDESAWQRVDGPMQFLPDGSSLISTIKRRVIKVLRNRN